MNYPFIIQGSNIVIVIDNKSHTISEQHLSYEKIKDAIKNEKWDQVKSLVDPVKIIVDYSQGNVHINDNEVFWKTRKLHTSISARLINMYKEDMPIDPMIKFMDNLMLNPSKSAVDELYGFMEACSLPITSDGHFLAYKMVNEDYRDMYTNTIDNSVGQIVEMPRNEVDDNRENLCSTGLHFCSIDYLHSSTKIMIVKIHPRDVVCIPNEYRNHKGRCCRYEVIGELGVPAHEAFTKSVQDNSSDNEEEQTDMYSYWEPVDHIPMTKIYTSYED